MQLYQTQPVCMSSLSLVFTNLLSSAPAVLSEFTFFVYQFLSAFRHDFINIIGILGKFWIIGNFLNFCLLTVGQSQVLNSKSCIGSPGEGATVYTWTELRAQTVTN